MNKPIKQLFSHRYTFPVWLVLPDAHNGQLMVQTKDAFTFASYFDVIDMVHCEIIYNGQTLNLDALFVPLVFHSGHILLQSFPDDQNPEVSDLLLWDIAAAKAKWHIHESEFMAHDMGFFYFRKKGKEGLVGKNIDGQENLVKANDWPLVIDNPALTYPHSFNEGDPGFLTIKLAVESLFNVTPVVGAEYLEHHNRILISYYIQVKNGLANYLSILDRSGGVELYKEINSCSKGIGRDTFFILANKLIYVENRDTIIFYEV